MEELSNGLRIPAPFMQKRAGIFPATDRFAKFPLNG